MRYYANSADFYGMFEADTFDFEEREGQVFRGYIEDENGERVLVAEFVHDNNNGGTGWYDTERI
jgi:hypothetical protein